MDIGGLWWQKGKAKGKGKGKGKDFGKGKGKQSVGKGGAKGGKAKGKAEEGCRNCGAAGHFARECTNKPKAEVTCRNCGKLGHYAKLCWKTFSPQRWQTSGMPWQSVKGSKGKGKGNWKGKRVMDLQEEGQQTREDKDAATTEK